MILTDEQAKAAQEVAKATGKALDVASGAGTVLVNGTVGKIASATLGLIGGDWVQEQRERNLAKMQAKTARILDGIAQDRLNAPSPSVVKPLLEAAADESREELQDLWAALLASAMVDGGRRVRRDYFDVVRQMEPADAQLLVIIGGLDPAITPDQRAEAMNGEVAKRGLSKTDVEISIGKLRFLECVESRGSGSNNPAVTHWLKPLGRGLLDACVVA
jgi:hypothetical protein